VVKCRLECSFVSKNYENRTILNAISLQAYESEIIALVGPSGSGKSTLLHIAGLLDSDHSGKVIINGQDCCQLSDGDMSLLRRNSISFVYQFHHLLMEFSAIENIMMPLLIRGYSKDKAARLSRDMLHSLGLIDKEEHMPSQLSGGERQRVSIGRALITGNDLVLADEPTGNLDTQNACNIWSILEEFAHNNGSTVLLATHDLQLAKKASRIIEIVDGKIQSQSKIVK